MGNYFLIMRFITLVLALLVILNLVEATPVEETELMTARCRRIAKNFVRRWRAIDTNHNGRIYWGEYYRAYVRWARKHGKSWAWIKKHTRTAYYHWKRWAGKKGYIWWKHVWNYIRKRTHCR